MTRSNKWSEAIERVLLAPETDFVSLAKHAGLDPAFDFRFANLVAVDFKDCDLAGFNFHRADMAACRFGGAKIANAVFTGANIDLTELAKAADWDTYRAGKKFKSRNVRRATRWVCQTTLARDVEVSGIGLHSGASVSIILHPAESDVGFRFLVNRRGRIVAEIAADVHSVKNLTLCTVIGDEAGITVGTVEHLLAALRGLGVDNCYIEIDNREVPIMDGSSAAFVTAIEEAGTRELSEPRKFIKVLKPVRVQDGDCFGELVPSNSFHLDVEIDIPTSQIGRQRMALELTPASFRNELSCARTFGFMRDIEKLWKAGLALGASLDNTVALGDDKIINPEGLRYPNEFVRHKMLDAVGELALAGAPILGAYKSVRGGHRLNAHVLRALFAGGEGQTWRWERSRRFKREAFPTDISAGIMAVNYSSDRS